MCGEQARSCSSANVSSGSSPRVRGTGRLVLDVDAPPRFIPACAGNSATIDAGTRPASVHPRVCGEQLPVRCVICWIDGSSPRVRGTAHLGQEQKEHLRFIPACAGNSSSFAAALSYCSVHPRVCGEQCASRSALVESVGSSPRVRGTAFNRPVNNQYYRFIPACAGNS